MQAAQQRTAEAEEDLLRAEEQAAAAVAELRALQAQLGQQGAQLESNGSPQPDRAPEGVQTLIHELCRKRSSSSFLYWDDIVLAILSVASCAWLFTLGA